MDVSALSWSDWAGALLRAVTSVSDEQIEAAAKEILAADMVITAGNGGSAALASHLAQAVAKPNYESGGGRPVVCLTDNVSTLTAHANDGGWSNALVEIAKPYVEAARRPVMIIISSSGKSENVVKLAEYAKKNICALVTLTGFKGEPLRSLSTVSLHVDSNDYEIVEPAHQALIHRTQYFIRQLSKKVA